MNKHIFVFLSMRHSYQRLILAAFSAFLCVLAMEKVSYANPPKGYCTHGTTLIKENGRLIRPTVYIEADFDGDGLTDYLCKDVRRHPSNSNGIFMWLILGNGETPYSAQKDVWCTHEGSRLSVETRRDRNILVCTDSPGNRWERTLP